MIYLIYLASLILYPRLYALLSANNAHKLAQKLIDIGYELQSKNFFNEFVLKVENADKFLDNLKQNNILGGLKIDDNRILVCTTEMNTDEEIESYINAIK